MNTPIIAPATLTEGQREAIMDRYNYHNPLEPHLLHIEDRRTNLTVRYILIWLFGEEFFKKGE